MVQATLAPVHLQADPRTTVTFDGQGITEFAGAALVVETMRRVGWRPLIEKHLPFERAKSPLAYQTYEVLTAATLGIALGASRPEHLDRLRADDLPVRLLGVDRLPSSVTAWRHINEYSEETATRLEAVNLKLVCRLLEGDSGPLDLDLDATVCTVYGKQEGAEKGYNPTKKGKVSYHPLLVACAKKGLVMGQLWRAGNSGAATGDTKLLDPIWAELPGSDRRRVRVRADAGHFAEPLMIWCEEHRVPFVIKGRKTKRLMREVAKLDFRAIEIGTRSFEAAELQYQADGWARARRCVVYRERKADLRDEQGRLFEAPVFEYTVLFTSRRLPADKLWSYYNARAGMENLIEDLKNSVGYGVAATDTMCGNRVWSTLQILAFNLLSPLTAAVAKRESVRPKVRTLRERLLRVGAKLAQHSRRLFIRLKDGWAEAQLFHALLVGEVITVTG